MNKYKLGTFTISGRDVVGLVFAENAVIEIEKANAEYQLKENVPRLTIPNDMKTVIAAGDPLERRLQEIITALSKKELLKPNRLGYVHDLSSVTIRPPIMYPNKLICAAVNFREHAKEGGRDPAMQEKAPPYFFFKPPTTTIIGFHDTVQIPEGYTMIDWEIEMGIIIGKRAKNVTPEDAPDYIFGYTIVIDVSNRDKRGNNNFGANWFVAKAHDTFAPMGPFIVPKKYISNAHDLRMTLKVNDKIMQDDSNKEMIHNQEELVSYASSIVTLEPGDIILSGTPSGVGAGRTPQIFLKSGDTITATIEEIGTLINPVK